MRTVAGILEGFDIERLTDILALVGSKLSHPESLSAIGVFVGNGEHLVGLQRGLQRDVSKGSVERIFRSGHQTGRSQFLVVLTALERRCQHRTCLVDVTGVCIGCRQLLILVVGIVLWQLRLVPATTPLSGGALAQFRECHDITRVGSSTGLVGHPHLDTCHVDAGCQVRQLLHSGIIALTEIAGEEEVAVLFVVGYVEVERCHLGASLRRDALGR